MAGGGGFMAAMVDSVKRNRALLSNVKKGKFVNNDSFFHKGDQLKRSQRDEKALKDINRKSKQYRASEKWIYFTILILIVGAFITVSYWWFFID